MTLIEVRVIAVLTAARALIARGWCQHSDALDLRSEPVIPDSIDAVRWCMLGAVQRSGLQTDAVILLLQEVSIRVRGGPCPDGMVTSLIGWNDEPGRTQAEVLEVFDAAIAAAKEEPWA